jgi:glutamine synthetase
MVLTQVLPAAINYKSMLAQSVKTHKDVGAESAVELDILKQLSDLTRNLLDQTNALNTALEDAHSKLDEEALSKKIGADLMPASFKVAALCNKIEELIPEAEWPVPKLYDMLFIR